MYNNVIVSIGLENVKEGYDVFHTKHIIQVNMNNKSILIFIGIVSAVLMFLIEVKYSYNIIKKAPSKSRHINKESMYVGTLVGFFGYIPFFSAFVSSWATYKGCKVLNSFSFVSILMVVICLLCVFITYKFIINNNQDDCHKMAKDMIKTLYFANSILLGLIIGIYEIIQKSNPIGFFGVTDMHLGREILFSILPIISYSAIDFFDIKKDLNDFKSSLKESFIDYYGFSVYLTLLMVGYVFFLNSKIFSYIFYGATIGAVAAFIFSVIKMYKDKALEE